MGEENDWKGLGILEKIGHKNWKARVEGYEQFDREIVKLEDQGDFNRYILALKNVPLDTNLPAQEKALELILKLSSLNESYFKSISAELSTGIVTKCLNSKPKIKNISAQIFLQFIENNDLCVVESLKRGLVVKQPKIICACVEIFMRALSEFGPSAVPVKLFFFDCLKLLEHGDKNVRDSVKNLVIELYKWIKDGIKSFIADIKPVQLKELQEEFQKVADVSLKPTRFIGGSSKAPDNDVGGAADEVSETPAFDPLDMIEPVDVVSKIPSEFYSGIVQPKWQERKEALENLEKVFNTPKIKEGDFGEILSCIKKVISSDSNINVVAIAVKCVEHLANGLRKSFSQYASLFLPLIFDKLKEKRGAIVENCRNCLNACASCLDAENVINVALPYLKNKSPSVKEETVKFIGRFVISVGNKSPKNLVKSLVAELSKALEDSLAPVRDATYDVLAQIMKIFGEKNVLLYLDNLDDIKKSKLLDTFKSLSAPVSDAAQPVKKTDTEAKVEKNNKVDDKTKRAPSAVAEQPKKAESESLPKPAPKQATKSSDNYDDDQKEPAEIPLSDEEVKEHSILIFGQENIDNLFVTAWKDRLTSLESIFDQVKTSPNNSFGAPHIYKLISIKPGFKDSNFQVLKARFQIVSYISRQFQPFPTRIIHEMVPQLIEKIADSKLKEQVYETLLDLSEASSVNFVNIRVISSFSSTKSVKNQIEALNYLNRSLTEFGLKIDIKFFMSFLKKSVDSGNLDIKKGCITIFTTLYLFLGDKLKLLIEDLKPQILTAVESEFDKVKGQPKPQPTRVKAKKDGDEILESGSGNQAAVVEEETPDIDTESLITRTDISQELTSELLGQIQDKNWKERAAGLEKLSEIFSRCKHIQPTIGDLPNILAMRFNDSNKNLIVTALNICRDLVKATGKMVDNHRGTLIPALMGPLSDGKIQIRSASIACLNAWVEICGISTVLGGDDPTIINTLNGKNSTAKCELITWLSQVIREKNVNAKILQNLVPSILGCIEDRNADTRKAVQTVIGDIASRIGCDIFEKKMSTLSSAGQNIVKNVISSIKPIVEPKVAAKQKEAPQKVEQKVQQGKEPDPKQADKEVLPPKKAEEKVVQADPRIIFKPNSQALRFKELPSGFSLSYRDFRPYIDQNLSNTIHPEIYTNLQNADFKKLCTGIQSLSQIIAKPTNDELNGLMESSDLILGFVSYKLVDANPSVLSKLLVFLVEYQEFLINAGKKLRPEEADYLLPSLIAKLSDNKEVYRKACKKCIDLSAKLLPVQTVFNHLYAGLDSKISKIKTECVNCIISIIKSENLSIVELSNFVKISAEMTKWLADKDNSLRNLAIAFFILIYGQIGDKVFDYTPNIGSKETTLLKDRFKRVTSTSFNKTFDMPSDQSTISISTNTSTFIESEVESTPTITSAPQTRPQPQAPPQKPTFDLNEFLINNGIQISTEIIKPTSLDLDFDPKFDCQQILPVSSSGLTLGTFIDLEKKLQSADFNLSECELFCRKLPILFEYPKLCDKTLEAMSFCQIQILKYILNQSQLQSLGIETLLSSFQLVVYIFHNSSFLKYVTTSALYDTFTTLFNLLELQVSANNPAHLTTKRISKNLLCSITEFIAVDRLLNVFCQLVQTQTSPSARDALIYLVGIVSHKLKREYACVNVDSDKFLRCLEQNHSVIYGVDQADRVGLVQSFDELTNAFLTCISSQRGFEDLKKRYSSVLGRCDDILKIAENPHRTIEDVVGEMLEKFERIPDRRLDVSKILLNLSLEHDFSLVKSQKFKEMKPHLQIFLKLYFDYSKNEKVKSIAKIENSNENGKIDLSPEYYLDRAKQFKESFNSMYLRKQRVDSPQVNSINVAGLNEDTLKVLIDHNIMNVQSTSKLEKPSTEVSKKSIEDLKRRFENIKKSFQV